MIPVVLIHNGFQDYLKYTLLQSNKNNYVYLLGDTSIDFKSNNFNFLNFCNFDYGFDEFKNNYIHLNTTPFEYELFCFKRWFILKNFMEQLKINNVFYIDSDVLLYVDVNDEWKKFIQYDMTILHRTAANSSFITYNGICNFCNFVLSTYKNKNSYYFKKIESHFMVRQNCRLPGGVCDMTLFECFHYNDDNGGGPGRVGEMMQIIDDSTYDQNINVPDNDFVMKNGIKDVKIINNIPYVFNTKYNKYIKFNSLHFQGSSKKIIKEIYERSI
jgi:hypothetical protein